MSDPINKLISTVKGLFKEEKSETAAVAVAIPESSEPVQETPQLSQEEKDQPAKPKRSRRRRSRPSAAARKKKAEAKAAAEAAAAANGDKTVVEVAGEGDDMQEDAPDQPGQVEVAKEEVKEKPAGPSRPAKSGARKARPQAKKEPAAEAEKKGAVKDAPVVKLFINAEEPEECRIALVENGKLESFHVTTVSREQMKGSIYKGRISAVEPSLQVAFVDIGTDKNGFLPFQEIHPEYYQKEGAAEQHWKDLNIQDVIKKGQEVLVQVVKEQTGNKGPSVTTYLSLPGRFLVLMPGSDSAGVSRKIEDEEQRASLREMMKGSTIPEGIGYIIRTASKDITKTALNKDLRFLLKHWREIKKRGQTMEAPSLIYQDQDIIAKFLRDKYTPEIAEILVDSQEAFDQVENFLQLLPTRQVTTRVKLYQGSRPIFNNYDIEEQIEQIYRPEVRLPSGGSIVINPTEALVAIDVNSGRTTKDKNFNETIFLVNMEAAAELARQLRLRDLGGLIVVDFIDMRSSKHIREVEKEVKNSMKNDKAKVDISRISKFGLMQISRQKMGQPVQMGSYRICEHCKGRGMIRSVEPQALFLMRRIQAGMGRKGVKKIVCKLPMDVAQYLLNIKREDLVEMEKKNEVIIRIEPIPDMNPSDHSIKFLQE